MDAKRHAQPIGRLCALLAGHVVLMKFGQFRVNDQVRVVTRSLSRLEVVRGLLASPRLSQDRDIIAKSPRISAAVRGGMGKMREWDRLDAADSGGGMAESGRWEGREGESCGRRLIMNLSTHLADCRGREGW